MNPSWETELANATWEDDWKIVLWSCWRGRCLYCAASTDVGIGIEADFGGLFLRLVVEG